MGEHSKGLSFADRYAELYEECEQKDRACGQDAMWWCRLCRMRLCENCAFHVHPDVCRPESTRLGDPGDGGRR